MEVHAGVVSAAEVNGPMATPGSGMSLGDLFHPKAPATWALIWFIVALLLLFVL